MIATELFHRRGEALDAPRPYTECGLEGIYLYNGYRTIHDDGKEFVEIEDREELHRTIALHLVDHRKALSGREFRFIRTVMNLTQRELAEKLGTTSQSLARWEKDQTELPGAADRLLRINFLLSLLDPDDFQEQVRNLSCNLEEMDEVRNSPIRFTYVRGEKPWREAA